MYEGGLGVAPDLRHAARLFARACNGAVYAACTHAVLSGPAIERIAKSQIKEVVATDSVPMSETARQMGKIKILSVAGLLARGIRSIHEETSISELFI